MQQLPDFKILPFICALWSESIPVHLLSMYAFLPVTWTVLLQTLGPSPRLFCKRLLLDPPVNKNFKYLYIYPCNTVGTQSIACAQSIAHYHNCS